MGVEAGPRGPRGVTAKTHPSGQTRLQLQEADAAEEVHVPRRVHPRAGETDFAGGAVEEIELFIGCAGEH